MHSSENKSKMRANQVLVSPEKLRYFLCKLANLDLDFVSARIEKAGIYPIYRNAGSASIQGRGWVRTGHEMGSAEADILEKISSDITKEESADVQRFIKEYGELIPPDPKAGDVKRDVLFWLLELQGKVSQVWIHSSQRAKHYGVFWIIQQLAPTHLQEFQRERDFLLVPAETPFERALFQLAKDWDLAKMCGNAACRKPYFFAARSSQKYCSLKCGKPALREAKRRWWKRERSGRQK